jgi:hypothetical protein
MTPRTRLRPRAAAVLACAAGALLALVAPAPAATAGDPHAAPVRVERVRPKHEKLRTLGFLKDNRDFVRARLDLLREKPLAFHAGAEPIDPRFLAYGAMLDEVRASRDSTATLEDTRQRRELLTSVTELGRLESELDQMDRLLAAQRTRLSALQEDFTGRQRTSLAVVVSGYPQGAPVTSISLTIEGGSTVTIPLTADEQASLARGGALEVFHGLVEPREQVLEVALAGERWPAGDKGFVTLEPPRDRMTFLKLDLAPVQPAGGATSIAASTWLHDDDPKADGDSTTHP